MAKLIPKYQKGTSIKNTSFSVIPKTIKSYRGKFTKGSQWEVVKDLKGYPSHSQGGVDIKLGKNGFSFTRDNGVIEAKHGLVLPDWNKVKSTLNPKNWGVKDYTNYGDRGAAYSSARKAGEKEFMWNNKRFSTDMEGTPEEQLKWSGITNAQTQNRNIIQERLSKNLNPWNYDNNVTRVVDAVVLNKNKQRTENKRRIDAFNLYMGKPQVSNTFSVSKYRPTISKDIDAIYYSINDMGVRDGHLVGSNSDIMGRYKTSFGKDDKGDYISYYDKWDINPFQLKNPITGKEITTDFGKPFEIYDRIYIKDYGDGNKKRMYYSDKELSELDVNKKNFNTLALQRELSNRGYKLPKSTKKGNTFDGILGEETKKGNTFDGILGEETKNALLDWQNKNKPKPILDKATGLDRYSKNNY